MWVFSVWKNEFPRPYGDRHAGTRHTIFVEPCGLRKKNHFYHHGHRLGGYMLELRSLESDVPRSPLDLGPPASGGGLIVRSRQ